MGQKVKTVLVLDGASRSGLAVTRSLGMANYNVIVGSPTSHCLAGSSKFCNCTVTYPDISKFPNEFRSWLLENLAKIKPDFLLPCTDATLEEVIKIETEVNQLTSLPYSKRTSLEATQDKFEIMNEAKNFEIECPLTVLIPRDPRKKSDFCTDLINHLNLPLVFKGRKSVQVNQVKEISKPPIVYAKCTKDVENFLNSDLPKEFEYVGQQFIEGEGRGLFLLLKEGQSVATFAHKRILEKPPQGGVSVLSESIPLNSALVKKSAKLLNSLNWYGIAMLEFKYTKDGKYYLMEINPRFWGSIQLAIDCGIDFPRILLENASAVANEEYTVGSRLRWELGLLDHFFIQLKKFGPIFFLKIIFRNYFGFLHHRTKNEVFRISDRNPFKFEVSNYLTSIYLKRRKI